MRARWGGTGRVEPKFGGYPPRSRVPRFGVEGCAKGGGRSSGVKGQGGGGYGKGGGCGGYPPKVHNGSTGKYALLAGTRQDLGWKGTGRVEGGVVGGITRWRVPAQLCKVLKMLKVEGYEGKVGGGTGSVYPPRWRVPAKIWSGRVREGWREE